ncbi:MAG: GNAT family N-acetyltransferase [Thermoplasmata archaeon]|nr:MAG: GNAT family N-acetyltransferase [Thermoplasmata archaeon]
MDDELLIVDPPAVPGLAFRRYRGEEDLPRLVRVFGAASAKDGMDWVVTVDVLKNQYDNMDNFDPRTDVVMAEVDGQTVGYGQVSWFHEADGTFAASHRERIHPDWRDLGITRAILSLNTERAREMAAAHAEGPWRMGTMVTDTEVHRGAVLEAAGFVKERWYYEMLRDLGQPIGPRPLPEGIQVRPVEEVDHRRVYEALWEAFRGSWAFREMTEKDWARFRGSPEFQPDKWVVGWDGDVVAGVVLGWINDEENERFDRLWGFNDDIGVAVAYRRKGLARALLTRSLVLMRDLGMEYANLGVDTKNPADALTLYESVGYRVRKEHYDLIRPMG